MSIVTKTLIIPNKEKNAWIIAHSNNIIELLFLRVQGQGLLVIQFTIKTSTIQTIKKYYKAKRFSIKLLKKFIS